MRTVEPTHSMRPFPADREWLTRRQADSFPADRPSVKSLVINRLDFAMEGFERSLEPADDDEDDAESEAADADGDEDNADAAEHEHGGQA